jgi:hypothetical protein
MNETSLQQWRHRRDRRHVIRRIELDRRALHDAALRELSALWSERPSLA